MRPSNGKQSPPCGSGLPEGAVLSVPVAGFASSTYLSYSRYDMALLRRRGQFVEYEEEMSWQQQLMYVGYYANASGYQVVVGSFIHPFKALILRHHP